MPDQKGEAYLHMKYFWDDSFEQPGLWAKLILEAEKEGLTPHGIYLEKRNKKKKRIRKKYPIGNFYYTDD